MMTIPRTTSRRCLLWGTLLLTGCGAAAVPPASGAEAVTLGEQRAPAELVPAFRVRAIHGHGCGLVGAMGNAEDAEMHLRNQAAAGEAAHVQVTRRKPPHTHDGCANREYLIEGVAYASPQAAAPEHSSKLPLSPLAHDIEKVPLASLKVRSIWRIGVDFTLAGDSASDASDSEADQAESTTALYDSSLTMTMGRFEYLQTMPVGHHVVLGAGGHVGLGEAAGNQCSDSAVCVGDRCECPGAQASWRGLAGKYGLTAGVGFKFNEGFPYFMIWLPTLRASHVITHIGAPNDECASVYGSCEGVSWQNVLLSATVDFEWPFSTLDWTSEYLGSGGCNLGLGVAHLQGDLADREDHQWMAYGRFELGFPHLTPDPPVAEHGRSAR